MVQTFGEDVEGGNFGRGFSQTFRNVQRSLNGTHFAKDQTMQMCGEFQGFPLFFWFLEGWVGCHIMTLV